MQKELLESIKEVCPRAREEGMLHRDKCPTGIGLPTRARGGRLPDNGDASPFMRWAREYLCNITPQVGATNLEDEHGN